MALRDVTMASRDGRSHCGAGDRIVGWAIARIVHNIGIVTAATSEAIAT